MFTPRTLVCKPLQATLRKALSTSAPSSATATSKVASSSNSVLRQLLASKPNHATSTRSMATYRSRNPIRRSQLKTVGPQGEEEAATTGFGSFMSGGAAGEAGAGGKSAFDANGGWTKIAVAGGTILGTIFISNGESSQQVNGGEERREGLWS
jgi:hypothetical protein